MPKRKDEDEAQDFLGPIIHYFGGKGRMLWRLRELYPAKFGRYFEPFVGGGAVLFDLRPPKAVINDRSEELLNLYRSVKEDAGKVIAHYEAFWSFYENGNPERNYYVIRDLDRDPNFRKTDPFKRAARFIFLCYSGFNGRYQVNRKGLANTTWGRRKRPHYSVVKKIAAVGEYFARTDIDILSLDGYQVLDKAKAGDFVFLDPPYLPMSKTAKFTDYTPGGFGFADQTRLIGAMESATERGVMWAYTNADRPMLWEVFGANPVYQLEKVPMQRMISGTAGTRGTVMELLVTNYDPKKGVRRG